MSDNTASNLGTGQGIFAQKVGDDLQFKSLIGGTNVSLTADANNITITASNDTTALNLGTGTGLFTSKSGDNLQLKSIIANAASGISVTSNTNDLTFQLVTANVDAGKLGGVVASDFLQKSNNLSGLASVSTARTNLSVYSKAEIDSFTVKNNANVLPDTDSTYSLGSNSYKWLNIYADNFYGTATQAGSISALNSIGNVNAGSPNNNDIIKYNSTGSVWETGTLSLLNLSDTPANYTSAANKFLRVNPAGNGVEFVTGIATESFVTTQITNLVGGAPGALDTLNELADALNDDAAFSTTITNSLAGKENTVSAGTTAQYYRGDKSFQTLDTDVVPEGSSNKYLTAGNMGTISIDALSDVRTTGSNSPSDAQALVWDNIGGYWKPGTVSGGGGGGSGDIEGVVAGTGLTGGGSTGTVTLNVDVGTTASKIVQLNGSAQLPAVSGALLTNINTDNLTEGSSNLFYTDTRFDNRLATKSTTNLTEGTNLYYTDARVNARVNALGKANWDTAYGWGDHSAAGYQTTAGLNGAIDTHLNQSNPTSGYVLSWNGSDYAWVANGSGGGDITAVVAGTGLTGGATSGSATLNVDVGTTANKILQLDGSAKIPAVDGSLLTNISFTPGADSISDTMIDFGTGGGQVNTADIPEVTNLYFTDARADARIGAASINALSDVNTSGVSSGQVLKWSGSAWVPGADTSPADTDALSEGSSNLYFTNARVDTHLNQSNPTAGYVLSWNGSDYAWIDNGAATPGGSNTQVQFNDSGSFAGDSGFTYNKTTDTLTVGSVTTTGASPNVSAAGNLGITTTASNGNITITPHNTGDIILDGQKWPQADGSANQYLKTNGAGQLSWDSLTTDDVAEGSNEYFTNAKAVSAVQAVNLDMGSNNITTTGKILFSNVYSAEGDLPNASTYHGMFAHVHATGAGYFAHGGNWIKLANNSQLANSSNWDTAYGWGNHASAGYLTNITGQSLTSLSNVDAVAGSDDGKVLYYDHSSTSFKWKTDATGGGTLNTAGNTGTGAVALASQTLQVLGTSGQINVDAASFALSLSLDPNINSITSIAFEGSTADTNETKLQAVDPTADNTINLPDASGHLAVFATASPAAITDGTSGQALVTNGSGQLSFADAGGGTDIQRFKINYSTTGSLASISDKTSGISSVSIDSAAGGDITINFTGYSYPPGSVTLYGYNYAANKYNVTPLNKDITLREIPGGGSSGSPTAFGSFSSMKIRAAEGDTGASRSFGTVTHAWVHVVMGG